MDILISMTAFLNQNIHGGGSGLEASKQLWFCFVLVDGVCAWQERRSYVEMKLVQMCIHSPGSALIDFFYIYLDCQQLPGIYRDLTA